MTQPTIIYLHGFASSPHGAKAQVIRERLAARGMTLRAPDLNVPDFRHLTITAMIERTRQEIADCPPGPVCVIGSSLGGFTALHFLDRFRGAEADRVTRLMLLAPAFEFRQRHIDSLPAEMLDTWRAQGAVPMFHYAAGEPLLLGYELVEDLANYGDGFDVTLDLPVVIYHGAHDESVDYRLSERFAAARDNVTLHVLDSDHGLTESIDTLWAGMVDFFGLA